MRRDASPYLQDVLAAGAAISAFLDGVDEDSYERDEMVHSAVERKFEIIGEALSQLSKQNPEPVLRIERFREIIAFRNLLIHGYAAVQHGRVHAIARISLPRLMASVETLPASLR